MRLFVIAMLTVVALAGCVSDSNDDQPNTPGNGETESGNPLLLERPVMPDEHPMTDDPTHDHHDVASHKFLWNYEATGHDPLLTTAVNNAGIHAMDVQAGHLFGAIYGTHAVDISGGLAIWDLEDPGNPQMTGQFRIPGAVGGDRSVGATEDGNYVVLGTEAVSCFGQVNPDPFRVYLFDTTDKTFPTIADAITLAGPSVGTPTGAGPTGSIGEHSIYVEEIDGKNYAFVQGRIYEIVVDEDGATLVFTGQSINTGHDLYIRETPWGDHWALVANGGGGFVVYDISNIENILEIANWNFPDRETLEFDYYFHTAEVAFFEDEIIFVVTSEDWGDHPSPMWILNGTDLFELPSEPIVLDWIGTWQNPAGLNAGPVRYSLHNPRMSDEGVMSLSMYHGGIWQFDFRSKDFRAAPAEVAYAVYADGTVPEYEDPVFDAVESNLCGLGIEIDAPTYMDVELGPDGIIYAADVYMGLYAFTPTEDHPIYGHIYAADHAGMTMTATTSQTASA